MKVSLRRFLEIVGGKDFIMAYMCYLTEVIDGEYGEEHKDIKFNNSKGYIEDIENLNPYLDYEIVSFDQEYYYGELDYQKIYIKKM